MHKRMMVILVSVLLAGASQVCRASSITLMSSSGGVYDYGLTLAAGEDIGFNYGQTITLSGLSGVTGALALGPNLGIFTVSSFNSTTVVFAQTTSSGNSSINNVGDPSPYTAGTFEVDSSVLTTGTVDFAIESSGPTVTGTVDGPVAAAAAEPGSLALLTLALVIFLPGALWVEQRRRRAAA